MQTKNSQRKRGETPPGWLIIVAVLLIILAVYYGGEFLVHRLTSGGPPSPSSSLTIEDVSDNLGNLLSDLHYVIPTLLRNDTQIIENDIYQNGAWITESFRPFFLHFGP